MTSPKFLVASVAVLVAVIVMFLLPAPVSTVMSGFVLAGSLTLLWTVRR